MAVPTRTLIGAALPGFSLPPALWHASLNTTNITNCAAMDLPDQYQPQLLRAYIDSYTCIARNAVFDMQRVTTHTATKGAVTNPEGRRAPKIIEPWTREMVD